MIERLVLGRPPHRDRHDLHATVSGQALAKSGDHGLNGGVGHPEGEVTAPPVPADRLVEAPHGLLEAVLGADKAADATDGIQAEVQQDLRGGQRSRRLSRSRLTNRS